MHLASLCCDDSLRQKPSIHDVQRHPRSMSNPVTLEIGDNAPSFTCKDSAGNEHDLARYGAEGKTVILYFYPRDSTPGCTKQACDFRDNMGRLNDDDYVVLGVSKDSETSHEKFILKQELNFPLLIDTEGHLHELFGTWRMKKNYGKEYLGCVRSTFVISPNGTIKWCRYNVRAKGHVDMLMRELGFEE